MNRKQNKTLATFAAIMVTGVAFWALPASAAQEGMPTGQLAQTQLQQPQMQQQQVQQQQVQQQPVQQAPIFESEKGWKFEKDSLVFFNPSQNQGGVRYIRWKDYNWMISQNQIIVSDPRPYGTTLQGTRNQMTSDGPQSDKDLMNDLKGQAGDIRNSRDPNAGRLPISIGIGLGFDFSNRHGGHHYRHH